MRRGESAIRILVPCTVRAREDDGEALVDDDGRELTHTYFKAVAVFDVSQTEPLPGTEPVPLEPPRQPIEGDSHAHLLAPLERFAAELGYAVRYAPLEDRAEAWCDPARREITVSERLAPNARVRALVHELAHALGVDYDSHSREEAEVIVDATAYVVCGGAGLDVSGESVPYVAGWGERGALEAVERAAQTIDELSRRLEAALGAAGGERAR